MDINDYVGYKLICVMSKEYKNESFYNENEFELVISEDPNEETGYKAVTTGYNEDEDENIEKEWDPRKVGDYLLFCNWVIKDKIKI